MKKWINFWLAVALSVNGLAVVGTGVLLHTMALPGPRGLFWSHDLLLLARRECREAHAYLALLFVVLILVHVGLHWGWIAARVHELREGRHGSA
ncbi:MAG: DUF4405 domain-containing protein [Armatimonadota bacterium]|nr:DUF4405 domain-containing protein [Armatimonadota bacterium]